MVTSRTVLAFTSHASFQPAGDGAVVLLADSGQLYTSNETTEAFLQKVDGRRDLGEIVLLFCDEFDVDRARATFDLTELANTLISENILRADDRSPE